MDEIPQLGMPSDRVRRAEAARRDDVLRKDKVKRAISLIHDHGYVVNSERVETELKDQSLVPTKVSWFNIGYLHVACAQTIIRTRFRTLWRTSLLYLLLIFYTSLSLESGKLYSLT